MKIGLIHTFYTYEEIKTNRPFPFGIAYIASYLIKNGHKAEILDLNTTYLKEKEIVVKLKSMKCDIFGISSLSGGFTYAKKLISVIKDNFNIPVIMGGPLATFNYNVVLRYMKADICVIGQGEHVARDILENIETLEKVKGIAYKDKNGVIVKNSAAPLMRLDEIPWPAYQLFDMEDYIWDEAAPDMDSKRRYKDVRLAQMITGRGCPMACKFCSKVMGRKILIRPVDSVIGEVKLLIKDYGINGIYFRDELYIMNREYALELAEKLKPLNIIWMGQARVDKVDYDLVKYMKKCGCISLGFGIESGSPKMLKLMDKGQTVDQIKNAVNICRKLDMDMKVQLVIGYPGEDKSTIEETTQLFKKLGHPGRRPHLITPLPGSVLYDDLRAQGVIQDETEYLTNLSRNEYGFSKGLPLINLTEFSDEELYRIKLDMERNMQNNYKKYLLVHPLEIFRYFYDRLIYKKYILNPALMFRMLLNKLRIFPQEPSGNHKNKIDINKITAEYRLSE